MTPLPSQRIGTLAENLSSVRASSLDLLQRVSLADTAPSAATSKLFVTGVQPEATSIIRIAITRIGPRIVPARLVDHRSNLGVVGPSWASFPSASQINRPHDPAMDGAAHFFSGNDGGLAFGQGRSAGFQNGLE